jgi:hypothetical protein
MNAIKRLYRAIRQQDLVDMLANKCEQYRTEALILQDQIDWRARRQSEGSKKGWRTRKARESEEVAA